MLVLFVHLSRAPGPGRVEDEMESSLSVPNHPLPLRVAPTPSSQRKGHPLYKASFLVLGSMP